MPARRLMVAAAAYLFGLTGKPAYRDYVDAHLADAGKDQYFAIEALVHYAALPGATAAGVAAVRRALAERVAEPLAPEALASNDPYRAFVPGYWWGSNMLKGAPVCSWPRPARSARPIQGGCRRGGLAMSITSTG